MKELTVLMPCLDEATTLRQCIKRSQKLLSDNNIDGEILVCDNGSTDESQHIARESGVRVVKCTVRGYGAALQHGIRHAKGKYILIGDSDDSYHFDEAMPLIEELRKGKDICVGTRFKGRIEKGAMPLLNRFIGNPILSSAGRIFFRTNLSDFHCGMRAFRRDMVLSLNLVTTGMEWASEMIVKARFSNLAISEVPITLYKDGRERPSHLQPWNDGWRHLRFMLLHAPLWLFFVPGVFLFFFGFLGELLIAQGPFTPFRGITLDVHTLLVMAFAEILGMQVIFTGVFAIVYSHIVGILPFNKRLHRWTTMFTLEELLVVSSALCIIGVLGVLFTVWKWYATGFAALNYQKTMRYLIPSLTLVTLGIQGIFNGFMLSILFLKTKTVESSPL